MNHEETTIDPPRESGYVNRIRSKERPVMRRHPIHRVVRRVRKSRFWSVGWLLMGTVLFSACAEEASPVVETIRAVRTTTVLEPASGHVRRFSGIVEAADTSSISFEVTGIIQSMEVDVGDRVENGQLLAVMDASAYRLNVDAATADVERARVEFTDAQNAYDRYRSMSETSGAISERAVELAEANRSSAQGSLGYSESRLRMARAGPRQNKVERAF